VRLTGAIFFDVAAHAPWVAEQPPREAILPRILPGAEHLIAYHVVTEGQCFANIVGGEPVAVEAGEVVVFTHGDPHVVSSGPGMRADRATSDAVKAATAGELPCFVNYGGEGPPVRLVCGFLACDARPFNPLIENLPRVIKAGGGAGSGRDWLGQFTRFAMTESADRRAGGDTVLAKLSELMFIEVVRQYLERLPAGQAGWLAGLRDPFVGRALSLLHAAPAQDWTIEELARQVGQSRSVLAERFTEMVGTPPIAYLAKWRMQVAWGLLSAGNANIATVAAEVGYGSEAAFSRAFKKVVGMPPSAWRRRREDGGLDWIRRGAAPVPKPAA
jgi:AraC-like DNA-binding protein